MPQFLRKLEVINEAFSPEEETAVNSFIESTPAAEYSIRLLEDVQLFESEEKIKVTFFWEFRNIGLRKNNKTKIRVKEGSSVKE